MPVGNLLSAVISLPLFNIHQKKILVEDKKFYGKKLGILQTCYSYKFNLYTHILTYIPS